MFLKIEGNLIDVLGDNARKDMEATVGIKVSPRYQFLGEGGPVTLAEVVDETKVQQITGHSAVTVLDTVQDFNNAIDQYFTDKYTLTDSVQLQLDLDMSGKTAADIPGYDSNLSLTNQANLKAMYDDGLAGISKKSKPPYVE